MEENKTRSLEDITQMLHLAKLSETDVLPTSQTIYFTPTNLYNNKYKFLELDQSLLNELQEGQTLYVKGDVDDNVVLCTESQTYDVVGAETSNSLLLVNEMSFFSDLKDEKERNFRKVTVSGIFYEYLCVSLSKPHLRKLVELLKKALYKGPEHEYEVNSDNLYTFEELNNRVQASERELKEELNKLKVVTINNKIRLLDIEYHFRVLSYMLKLIDENSWKLDEIDFDETLNSLKDVVPEEIIISLFDTYTQESKIVDGLQLYSYRESDICRFFAEIILFGAGKFNLEEFLQAWRESVPEGMNPEEDLLNGIAIVDRKANVISGFPEAELPENVTERFDTLFSVKEKWTVAEIAPYIQRLATPKMDAHAILSKFARASTVDGVKYYSAKHAK